jgi:hypothetical protein
MGIPWPCTSVPNQLLDLPKIIFRVKRPQSPITTSLTTSIATSLVAHHASEPLLTATCRGAEAGNNRQIATSNWSVHNHLISLDGLVGSAASRGQMCGNIVPGTGWHCCLPNIRALAHHHHLQIFIGLPRSVGLDSVDGLVSLHDSLLN